MLYFEVENKQGKHWGFYLDGRPLAMAVGCFISGVFLEQGNPQESKVYCILFVDNFKRHACY